MAVGIPPYVAYRTFENFLTELKARGIPSRIDRSILSHKSGTVQSQLLLALRYLDLSSDNGRPTEKLRALVASEGGTKRNLLREIVKSAYSIVFHSGIDLRSATSTQMEELFQQTGASGETVRRCMAFFLAAARSAGIPFSSYLKPHRGKKSALRTSDGTSSRTVRSNATTRVETPLAARSVDLKSGGSLKMEMSFDIFDLDREDRQFVFDLIDRLNQYSQESST